jgi:hypothetical protein
MESVFLLKNTYRAKSKWKKRKYCERKNKKENRETTLNISHNSPRILIAEKQNKKETIFCLKYLGLGA